MKKANADKMIRQVKNILIYIIVVNIFGIIALLTFLYVLSPGKIESFKDKTGVVLKNSISEKTFVDIVK